MILDFGKTTEMILEKHKNDFGFWKKSNMILEKMTIFKKM
jgi:hypothetical protein